MAAATRARLIGALAAGLLAGAIPAPTRAASSRSPSRPRLCTCSQTRTLRRRDPRLAESEAETAACRIEAMPMQRRPWSEACGGHHRRAGIWAIPIVSHGADQARSGRFLCRQRMSHRRAWCAPASVRCERPQWGGEIPRKNARSANIASGARPSHAVARRHHPALCREGKAPAHAGVWLHPARLNPGAALANEPIRGSAYRSRRTARRA